MNKNEIHRIALLLAEELTHRNIQLREVKAMTGDDVMADEVVQLLFRTTMVQRSEYGDGNLCVSKDHRSLVVAKVQTIIDDDIRQEEQERMKQEQIEMSIKQSRFAIDAANKSDRKSSIALLFTALQFLISLLALVLSIVTIVLN